MQVELSGKGSINWMEHKTNYVGNGQGQQVLMLQNSNHFNFKTYLEKSILLLGSTNGSSIELQAGIHKYEFSIQLPEDLPSTVFLGCGDIFYTVTAVLKQPNNSEDIVEEPLIILREFDLNLYPTLCVPQKFEEVKNFCCFFCASGPFSMTVTVPSTGFCLGENVPIKIDYVNKSNVEVYETKLLLKRTVTYKAFSKCKIDVDIMAEIHASGVKAKNSNSVVTILEVYDNLKCSTDSEIGPLISISYSLDIVGDTSRCHLDPIISFPVVIGNVPIRSMVAAEVTEI